MVYYQAKLGMIHEFRLELSFRSQRRSCEKASTFLVQHFYHIICTLMIATTRRILIVIHYLKDSKNIIWHGIFVLKESCDLNGKLIDMWTYVHFPLMVFPSFNLIFYLNQPMVFVEENISTMYNMLDETKFPLLLEAFYLIIMLPTIAMVNVKIWHATYNFMGHCMTWLLQGRKVFNHYHIRSLQFRKENGAILPNWWKRRVC